MIYREIEDTDKVFGRTQRLSSGSFSDGFYLDVMYIDDSVGGELDTPLSKHIVNVEDASSSSQDITELSTSELEQRGLVVSRNSDLSSYEDYWNESQSEGTLNLTATNNYHEELWTSVSYGDYYANIYNNPVYVGGVLNENARPEMSITYGHRLGFGSRISGGGVRSVDVTKAVYNQYKNILLGPGDEKFTFPKSGNLSGVDKDHVYIINFSSNALKERIDEGNLEFTLKLSQTIKSKVVDGTPLTNDETVEWSLTLRDDSRFQSQTQMQTGVTKIGRVFNLVKGSISDTELTDNQKYAISQNANNVGLGEGFGLFYPDLGIVVINPDAIANEIGGNIQDQIDSLEDDKYERAVNNVGMMLSWCGVVDPLSNQSADLVNGIEKNHQNFLKLFTALQLGANFKSRSSEFIPSKHYFIRVRNTDFNYSNNPTFVYQNQEATRKSIETNSDKNYWLGRVRFNDFVNDPRTYITTVGLYNENNELVAVAKLSVPILKTFDTETLIKVKLDF
jgi:hypothetical protein